MCFCKSCPKLPKHVLMSLSFASSPARSLGFFVVRFYRSHLRPILRLCWTAIISWMTFSSDLPILIFPRSSVVSSFGPDEIPVHNRVLFSLLDGILCLLSRLLILRVGSVVFNSPHHSVFPSSQRTFFNNHLYPPSKPSPQVPEFGCVPMSISSVLTRTLS